MRIGLGIDVHAFAGSPFSGEGSAEGAAHPTENPSEQDPGQEQAPGSINNPPRRPLILGGVHIEHTKSLEGHSDADVLTHAIMDALLGAARLGDIGKHFPPTDPAYKDADSIGLLRHVKALIGEAGWEVEDIDCVIIAQEPRLSPHRDHMRANIAEALEVSLEQVGIKATTSEHLGFEGRKEGISAYAVVLLQPAC